MATKILYTKANPSGAVYPADYQLPGSYIDRKALFAAHPELDDTPPPPPTQTLEDARDAKLAEIVAGANAVKQVLARKYSALEEASWPEQEAGARVILNRTDTACNVTARLIMSDAGARALAVSKVEKLAQAAGTSAKEFATRIMANAEIADSAGDLSLLEQGAMEAAVKGATTVAQVQAIEVKYSVLSQGTS